MPGAQVEQIAGCTDYTILLAETIQDVRSFKSNKLFLAEPPSTRLERKLAWFASDPHHLTDVHWAKC